MKGQRTYLTRLLSYTSLPFALCLAGAVVVFSQGAAAGQLRPLRGAESVVWLNHFELLPGGTEVTTSFNSTSSGVGSGLTGLVITSSTTGDRFSDGGNKVVHMAVEAPPDFGVTGVRVCYELSNARSFISQVRLAQVQDPPSSATVLLDDATDLTNRGPLCVNSQPTEIDPRKGALILSLRVNFGDTADRIVIRGLALRIRRGLGR